MKKLIVIGWMTGMVGLASATMGGGILMRPLMRVVPQIQNLAPAANTVAPQSLVPAASVKSLVDEIQAYALSEIQA